VDERDRLRLLGFLECLSLEKSKGAKLEDQCHMFVADALKILDAQKKGVDFEGHSSRNQKAAIAWRHTKALITRANLTKVEESGFVANLFSEKIDGINEKLRLHQAEKRQALQRPRSGHQNDYSGHTHMHKAHNQLHKERQQVEITPEDLRFIHSLEKRPGNAHEPVSNSRMSKKHQFSLQMPYWAMCALGAVLLALCLSAQWIYHYWCVRRHAQGIFNNAESADSYDNL